ncbi:MAG: peptidoglycan DD-metalloendopeptidase family protein [Hyphomonas sp.]|jgi:murein DD-endopeptidase MepM/ murein hydrolase activator NlpD|nr:peptidoglycan DD-metalloendopeptidase family protein [Hyphomonas sp.]MDP3459599.1 peptidoglycan DD-metalloendopeptidase family protein [Hyphomonas sp.]
MAKWSSNLKATFDRAFPERQIYHRSGGTVRYISVSPWQQAMMAAGVTAIAGWTVFATASFVFGGSETTLAGGEGKELAKYERWVQDLRARESLQRTLLEERSKETADLEKKQKALEDLLNDMREDDGQKLSALEGDGASLLVEASIEEADRRQSRDEYLMTAGLSVPAARGTPKAIEQDIYRLFDRMEDHAAERAERARGVLMLTAVGTDNLLANSNVGGPEVSVGALTSSASEWSIGDQDFITRIFQARARIAEMKYYEEVISKLPLGEPVSVPFRYTSPYGIRVDPFTRRPRAHMGVDMAAYRDAPIVTTGPGSVSYAGARSGYGLLVEIDHGHGFKSRYGHLRSITVSKGDTVKIGDLVGRMGSTGRSTGDHLHYEVWYNGKPYDPNKFLKAGRHVHKK